MAVASAVTPYTVGSAQTTDSPFIVIDTAKDAIAYPIETFADPYHHSVVHLRSALKQFK
jgi:hypothetical protein